MSDAHSDPPPPRLLDPAAGLPESARRALRSVADDGPSPAQRAALRARIDRALADGTPARAASSARGPRRGARLLRFAVPALVLVAAAGWIAGRQLRRPAAAPPPPETARRVVVDAPRSAPRATASTTPPSTVSVASGGLDVAPVAPPRGAATADEARASSPGPRPRSGAPHRAAGPTPNARAPGPADAAPPGGESETALLSRAHAALRAQQPDAALAITAEHAARFPDGMLAEDRERIAIDALLRLGRRDEARRRGERFLARHAGSPLRPLIEALLGRDAGAR